MLHRLCQSLRLCEMDEPMRSAAHNWCTSTNWWIWSSHYMRIMKWYLDRMERNRTEHDMWERNVSCRLNCSTFTESISYSVLSKNGMGAYRLEGRKFRISRCKLRMGMRWLNWYGASKPWAKIWVYTLIGLKRK